MGTVALDEQEQRPSIVPRKGLADRCNRQVGIDPGTRKLGEGLEALIETECLGDEGPISDGNGAIPLRSQVLGQGDGTRGKAVSQASNAEGRGMEAGEERCMSGEGSTFRPPFLPIAR